MTIDVTKSYAPFGGDLIQDYAALRAYQAGDGLYENNLSVYLSQDLAKERPDVRNAHSPLAVMLHAPLLLFEIEVGFILWTLLQAGMILLAVNLSLKLKDLHGIAGSRWKSFLYPLVLLWYPSITQHADGQHSALLFLIVSLFLLSWEHQKNFLASLCLAFLFWVKIFPALFVLPFLFREGLSAFRGLLVSMLALALFPLPFLGAESYLEFIAAAQLNSERWNLFPPNNSLKSILCTVFELESFPAYKFIVMAVSLGLICLFRKVKSFSEGSGFLTFYFFCLSALLLSPVAWAHYYLMLTPLLLFFLSRYRSLCSIFRVIFIFAVFLFSLPNKLLIDQLVSEHGHALLASGQAALLVKTGFWGVILLLILVSADLLFDPEANENRRSTSLP